MSPGFEIAAPYEPQGDQPEAIRALRALDAGGRTRRDSARHHRLGQDLHRRQGDRRARPADARALAQQDPGGATLRGVQAALPRNAVEYFVSYYDYYQPEAYVAASDTYIEKDASRNENLERLRNSATRSLLERRDVLIVASVSCIYGLGSPAYYAEMSLALAKGDTLERDELLRRLTKMQYSRNNLDFRRGTFRARGDGNYCTDRCRSSGG